MSVILANKFANAMDAGNFELAASLIAPDCRYEIGDKIIFGRENIIASYHGNTEWAKSAIDQVVFKSEVESLADGYLLHYRDYITHKGSQHTYRCRQLVSFNLTGLIDKIVHQELPREREALKEFEANVGIVR